MLADIPAPIGLFGSPAYILNPACVLNDAVMEETACAFTEPCAATLAYGFALIVIPLIDASCIGVLDSANKGTTVLVS